MRIILSVCLLLALNVVHGQDITGVWHGHFQAGGMGSKSSANIFDTRYKFEVQVAQNEKTFEAVTYSYLSSVFYGKADAKGTVNTKTAKVLLQEGKLLELRMSPGDVCCTMTCFLKYTKLGDEEYLEGSYVSMNIKDSSNCGRGTIMLRKVENSDFYKEPFLVKKEAEDLKKDVRKKDSALVKNEPPLVKKNVPGTIVRKKPPVAAGTNKTPGPATTAGTPAKQPSTAARPANPGNKPRNAPAVKITGPSLARIGRTHDSLPGNRITPGKEMTGEVGPLITPEVLRSRSNELVRTITVNTNEVELNIYDDGAIDNDTISVYLDKKQVISHAMLTDRAIVLKIPLDGTNNYHELVMVAENEGTIPPNTSLMIVKAGDKRYEVRITSTEQKNAVVIFKYEKSDK